MRNENLIAETRNEENNSALSILHSELKSTPHSALRIPHLIMEELQMKTKHWGKLLVLIISIMMIATLLTGMSVTANAEEAGATTPVAEITAQQVNLGGDISMKYYVTLHDTTKDPNSLKLLVTFLGTQYELSNPALYEKTGEYVFTFEGINPQCMGDLIDAELYRYNW